VRWTLLHYRTRRALFSIFVLAVAYVTLLAPIAFVMLSSFDYGQRAYVVFPPEQFTLESYWRIPMRYWEALWLSLRVAFICMIVACAIGIPAAIGIVRSNLPGKGALLALFRAPMQIPAVVSGVAFLHLYYLVGPATGLPLAGSFLGLVTAHIFAATPYVVGTLVSVLQRFDTNLEEASLSLGASRTATFAQVTLPMLKPGIFAGALYAFMISFSEVPISVFLSGSKLVTFPVEVFNSMLFDFEPTILAISSIVTVLSLTLVWLAQWAVGLDKFVNVGGAD
jgi:putative spermidine/putrescine transport system permease protein